MIIFFFSSRRRHTRSTRDWSSDVCSSDLLGDRGVVLLRDFLPDLDGLIERPCQRRRSEERRVGKECRSRWSPCQKKKKKRTGRGCGCGERSAGGVGCVCLW